MRFVRPLLVGLAFAFAVFVVVAGPQLLAHPPVETNPPIGPGDVQNQSPMNAAYKNALEYRDGALGWQASWQTKYAAAQQAIADAQNAYRMRQRQLPPMYAENVTYYNEQLAAAQNWLGQSSQKNYSALASLSVGDGCLVDGADWEADAYFYYAWSEYTYSFSSVLPVNGADGNEDGSFPNASLRWAQGIDFANNAITQANNAKAVCQ